MSSNRTLVRLALGALSLGAALPAPSAHAQSCDEPVVVHSSYPADGAMGVPTNTPVYLYGPELEIGTHDITLEDGSGTEPSIEVLPAEGGLLVDAFLGLQPSTTYDVTVTPRAGGEGWSATFTTGTGPSTPVQLEAPIVGVSVINQVQGSCGVVSAICATVAGGVPARMTIEVLVGEEVLSLGGGQPAPAYPAVAAAIASNACIDVRVREPGGFVSPATRRCGDEIERFELAENAPVPTSCQAYAVLPDPPMTPAPGTPSRDDDVGESSADSGGCALGTSPVAPGAGGFLLALSALLAARLRRRAH